jgi:hypothetical protein
MPLSMAMLALAATGIAQNREITADSNVGPNQIKAWLQGNDSRLIAWGAYFASKSEDVNEDAYVIIMIGRMARWIPSPITVKYSSTTDQSYSFSEQIYYSVSAPICNFTLRFYRNNRAGERTRYLNFRRR